MIDLEKERYKDTKTDLFYNKIEYSDEEESNIIAELKSNLLVIKRIYSYKYYDSIDKKDKKFCNYRGLFIFSDLQKLKKQNLILWKAFNNYLNMTTEIKNPDNFIDFFIFYINFTQVEKWNAFEIEDAHFSSYIKTSGTVCNDKERGWIDDNEKIFRRCWSSKFSTSFLLNFPYCLKDKPNDLIKEKLTTRTLDLIVTVYLKKIVELNPNTNLNKFYDYLMSISNLYDQHYYYLLYFLTFINEFKTHFTKEQIQQVENLILNLEIKEFEMKNSNVYRHSYNKEERLKREKLGKTNPNVEDYTRSYNDGELIYTKNTASLVINAITYDHTPIKPYIIGNVKFLKFRRFRQYPEPEIAEKYLGKSVINYNDFLDGYDEKDLIIENDGYSIKCSGSVVDYNDLFDDCDEKGYNLIKKDGSSIDKNFEWEGTTTNRYNHTMIELLIKTRDYIPSLCYRFVKNVSDENLYKHLDLILEIESPRYCYKFLEEFDLTEEYQQKILDLIYEYDLKLYEKAIKMLENKNNPQPTSQKDEIDYTKELEKIRNMNILDIIDLLSKDELIYLQQLLKTDKPKIDDQTKSLIKKLNK